MDLADFDASLKKGAASHDAFFGVAVRF